MTNVTSTGFEGNDILTSTETFTVSTEHEQTATETIPAEMPTTTQEVSETTGILQIIFF